MSASKLKRRVEFQFPFDSCRRQLLPLLSARIIVFFFFFFSSVLRRSGSQNANSSSAIWLFESPASARSVFLHLFLQHHRTSTWRFAPQRKYRDARPVYLRLRNQSRSPNVLSFSALFQSTALGFISLACSANFSRANPTKNDHHELRSAVTTATATSGHLSWWCTCTHGHARNRKQCFLLFEQHKKHVGKH